MLFFKRKIHKQVRTEDDNLQEKTFVLDGDIRVSIKRVSFRQFYDTEWQIYVEDANGVNISAKITRYETETVIGLENAIRNLGVLNLTKLKELDQRKNIWYD